MRYPNKPAVVLFNAYIWFQAYPFPGSFWSNSEREFSEFGLYYHLPTISLKSAVYQKLAAGEPGFLISNTRNKDQEGLKEKAFYWDPIHPDGRTGARVMAELAIHLIDSTLKELEARPLQPYEIEAAHKEGTQAPMIPGNPHDPHDPHDPRSAPNGGL